MNEKRESSLIASKLELGLDELELESQNELLKQCQFSIAKLIDHLNTVKADVQNSGFLNSFIEGIIMVDKLIHDHVSSSIEQLDVCKNPLRKILCPFYVGNAGTQK
jgi:hypothetical protein